MKLASFKDAYWHQKIANQRKDIAAYKVGASNFRSSVAFNFDGILVGGIEYSNIFFDQIPFNYELSELEIVCKIELDPMVPNSARISETYLGLECPKIGIENTDNSPLITVLDNCSAGDLIIFKETLNLSFSKVQVRLGKSSEKISGEIENLRFSVDEIITRTLNIIEQYDLPKRDQFFVATGGITDTFQLKQGESVDFVYG